MSDGVSELLAESNVLVSIDGSRYIKVQETRNDGRFRIISWDYWETSGRTGERCRWLPGPGTVAGLLDRCSRPGHMYRTIQQSCSVP